MKIQITNQSVPVLLLLEGSGVTFSSTKESRSSDNFSGLSCLCSQLSCSQIFITAFGSDLAWLVDSHPHKEFQLGKAEG